MTLVQYTVDEISAILFAGYEYKLPEQTSDRINNLINELGIHLNSTLRNNGSRNVDPKNSGGRKSPQMVMKRNKSTQRLKDSSDEQWNRLKEFKATVLEKKEGTDKVLNEIRSCLNKISEKSYQAQLQSIKQSINDLLSQYDDASDETTTSDNFTKIANFIIDVARTNKLNSVLYANLYKELIVQFPIFQKLVNNIVNTYKESIRSIKYVDSSIDYDAFCDNNKSNDNRKSMVAFIINLMNIDVLSKEELKNTIITLQDLVINYIDEAEKTNEVDEITENIFIFITMMKRIIISNEECGSIIKNIDIISKYKAKDHPSLSSRAIFKHMDMIDLLKKEMK